MSTTTLLDELETAARRAESLARGCDAAAMDDPRLGGRSNAYEHRMEAHRLRERMGHIAGHLKRLQDVERITEDDLLLLVGPDVHDPRGE